jgi:hypothetical protein
MSLKKSFSLGLLIVSNCIILNFANAQSSNDIYLTNSSGRNEKIGWSHASGILQNATIPAISVYGKNGGTAIYLGNDKRGVYLLLDNKKYLLWNGADLLEVAKVRENLTNKPNENVIVPVVAAAPNEKFYKILKSFTGDPFFLYPNGRNDQISWAYTAGLTITSRVCVWLNGDGKSFYHGYDAHGSYLTNTKTGKIFKWDGKNLEEVSQIPEDLEWNWDRFVKYGNPGRNTGVGIHHRDVPVTYDPFLPGIWSFNTIQYQLGWYYPSQPQQGLASGLGRSTSRYPLVTIFGKDGGDATYNGYDENGSYFTLNGKHLLWDGDNIQQVNDVPSNLYNKPDENSMNKLYWPSPSSLFNKAASEDPFMPNRYDPNNPNTLLEWVYNTNKKFPTTIQLKYSYAHFSEIVYRGYNEYGSFLTLQVYSSLSGVVGNILWNGKDIIPLEKIPNNLLNSNDMNYEKINLKASSLPRQ